MQRELDPSERKTIRKLVLSSCANFDKEQGCLSLDCPCYMLGKWYTGSFCTYFRNAILPLDTRLSASLSENGEKKKTCAFCATPFVPKTHEWYCCENCRREARADTMRRAKQKERRKK